MNTQLLETAIELHRKHCTKAGIEPLPFRDLKPETQNFWERRAALRLKPKPPRKRRRLVTVGSIEWLDALAKEWERRIERYYEKKAKAEGTDVINQGAKIKATTECLNDLRAWSKGASN